MSFVSVEHPVEKLKEIFSKEQKLTFLVINFKNKII